MTTADFSARLTEAFRPVQAQLPPALPSTLVDLHRAAGAQDLAGTLKHGARLAGLLSGMPSASKSSSTATPATPSADGAPPEPPTHAPCARDYPDQTAWSGAFKLWRLARERWRAWRAKSAAREQARAADADRDWRAELERARRGE